MFESEIEMRKFFLTFFSFPPCAFRIKQLLIFPTEQPTGTEPQLQVYTFFTLFYTEKQKIIFILN